MKAPPDYARIASESRRAQGLSDHVEDDLVLARVAALVARRDGGAPLSTDASTDIATARERGRVDVT